MHNHAHGYFGLAGIGNVVNQVLPNPLVVTSIQNLENNAQEVKIYITGCSHI